MFECESSWVERWLYHYLFFSLQWITGRGKSQWALAHLFKRTLSWNFPVLHLAKYVLEYTILLKVDCHFPPGCLQCNCFMKVFIAVLNNIRMILLLWMLMCITLYIIAPAQALPHCVHMVAQWHLPSHPLSSVRGGKW